MSVCIYKNKNLRDFSTFGLEANASYLLEFDNIEDLYDISEFVRQVRMPAVALGDGSNMIFCSDFPGVLIRDYRNDVHHSSPNKITVSAGAKLDYLVDYTVGIGLFGLETLSGIPGTIGGAIALNAGAYGSTIKDCIESVRTYNIATKSIEYLNLSQIHYWHRSSIFRDRRGENQIILDATFKLKNSPVKYSHPKISANVYGKELRNNILNLRKHFPDYRKHRNSGSFFLNPTLPNSAASYMLDSFPDCSIRKYDAKHYQISAGWLIENSGLKGKNINGFLISPHHANLVINKNLSANGQDLAEFINIVQKVVDSKFKVQLVPEPILVGEEFLQGKLLTPSLSNITKVY